LIYALCHHRQTADEAQPLEGRRYHVHSNGTLQINRTTEEDAGSYSCWVENAKGKTAVTASLDIRSIFTSFLLCMISQMGLVCLYFCK
jgi:hypothetical protein